MVNIVEFGSVELTRKEKRLEEACRWIAKIDRGISEQEHAELRQWMSDGENLALLEEQARLWDRMDSLSRLSEMFPRKAENPGVLSGAKVIAIAASFFLAVFSGLLLWKQNVTIFSSDFFEENVSSNIYQTAVGEFAVVTLVDGSQLTLNTNTHVEVDFTPDYRLIRLGHGEINVKVAKDPQRPLGVMADGKLVQAVGTEFNVEITEGKRIELVVTEGKVHVTIAPPKTGSLASDYLRNADAASQVALTAGEQVLIESDSAETIRNNVSSVSTDEIEVKLSWKHGNLVFRGEPLEDAVREVSRYTSVEFVFLDEELKKVRVAGLFRAGDVDSLLRALRENFNIVSTRTDDKKVLLSSK